MVWQYCEVYSGMKRSKKLTINNKNGMNMGLAKAVIGVALAISTTFAQADNYLFPTDVLPKGNLDVQAQFSYLEYDQDVDADIAGLPLRATIKTEVTGKSIRVRYGVGSNWHIGAILPYTDVESYATTRSGSAFIIDGSKSRSTNTSNALLFAKHQFDLPELSPYTLAATAILLANTANNGYTGVETSVSAGYLLNDKARAYADLSATFYDIDSVANNEELNIGLFYKFDPNLTFVPQYKLKHIHKLDAQGVTFLKDRYIQSIGIEAQIPLTPKTYLLPYFGLEFFGESKNDFGIKTQDSNEGKRLAISLYHLF
jgi:hypothetical protein